MLQRSMFSGLLLSAAVATVGVFGMDSFAQTPAPAMGTAPAADPKLVSQADDFLHFSLVNNTELAKANGEALLAGATSPEALLMAFDAADNGRNFRNVMLQDQHRDELKDVSGKLLDRLEEGFRNVARNPKRIREEIERLGSGPRGYQTGRDRLASAGQYAVPIMLEYLQNASKKDLHGFIIRAMGEIGRPILTPLIEELHVSDPTLKIELVGVIGQIGYPQALPMLRSMQSDQTLSPETRMTVDKAISMIDRTGRAAQLSASDLYLAGGENYYTKKASYMPPMPEEKTNPVWYFDSGLNNVVQVSIPTEIWNSVMALRSAEAALKIDPTNASAISLWLTADLSREIQLPAGAADGSKSPNTQAGVYYALAAGPAYLNPVLARALDNGDSALALRAIDALEATGGVSGLVSNADAPLVRALSHSDKSVRFHAASALARANPMTQFPSHFRVVPILSEAISSTPAPAATQKAGAEPAAALVSAESNSEFALASLKLLDTLASDHRSIFSVTEALPALSAALSDKNPQVVAAAAGVIGKLNSPEGERALASSALSATTDAGLRVSFFTQLAESAKRTGNALDASAIDGIIKVVSSDSDAKVRLAAAGALGALNVPSNQASTLILQQVR